ncbi:MAG: HEPN domain-containing protein [Ignavibacteriales bacterium]|nr:HEPN domain-containing protein [Ignavibacteriales bacterium]
MAENPEEWLLQADYDLETAKVMFESGRYFYAVFMVHLAIEKGLKGLFWKVRKEIPPKTHHLKYLVQKINLDPSDRIKEIIFDIDDLSVPTRYPESLKNMLSSFSKEITDSMIINSIEVLKWLKEMFQKY